MSCNVDKINKGDVLSEIQYYTVKEKRFDFNGGVIIVTNEREQEIQMSFDIVADGCFSASEYNSVEKVTKTELAEIFKKYSRMAMTVCFNKQVKMADLLGREIIEELYPSTRAGETKAQFVKRVKGVLKEKMVGEERVMVGRHYGKTDINGRVTFVDMEQPIKVTKTKDGGEYDTRSRLVDPRAIKFLIVNQVKYEVK